MPPSGPRATTTVQGPAKVPAGAQPHDEAAYGLLKALVFAAADAAAALAADDLAGYQKALPALREASAAYLAGYAPASPGTPGRHLRASSSTDPTWRLPAGPSSPSAPQWRTWPAASMSTTGRG